MFFRYISQSDGDNILIFCIQSGKYLDVFYYNKDYFSDYLINNSFMWLLLDLSFQQNRIAVIKINKTVIKVCNFNCKKYSNVYWVLKNT